MVGRTKNPFVYRHNFYIIFIYKNVQF